MLAVEAGSAEADDLPLAAGEERARICGIRRSGTVCPANSLGVRTVQHGTAFALPSPLSGHSKVADNGVVTIE